MQGQYGRSIGKGTEPMRRDTMGIILTSNDRIPPITDIRANSALPIAGRYRIIDFVLSCMANSGITNTVCNRGKLLIFDGPH